MFPKMVLATPSSHSGEETGRNQAKIEYAGGKKTHEEHFMASKGGGEIFTYKAVKWGFQKGRL